jgi:hypothetical protein
VTVDAALLFFTALRMLKHIPKTMPETLDPLPVLR